MILNFFSAIWAATAPALGNHLWQSTLCVIIAGLLTLVLRKNSARTRYGIWLAASIKFLLPFSLLIAIGTHWARPRPAAASQPGLFYAMEQASQPFTPAAQAEQSRRPAQDTGVRYTLAHLLPAIFVAAWFCGFVAVVLVWYARWRRIAATVRDAAPLSEGREVEALRSVERRAGIRKPIDLRVSRGSLEPGIFGISRPVLVWPEAISERLDDAQLKAILAHEVWHVRRRDNLAAAIHMVVEALFWFHPLVWWLTARLVEERERACDEAVLKVGSERQVYAESILKTCEFCLESPLACVSGVTGADLKRRIVRIMTQSVAKRLSLSRKLLLASVGMSAIAGPIVFGLVNAPQIRGQSAQIAEVRLPSFEVTSVKPSGPQSGRHTGVYNFPGGKIIGGSCTVKILMFYAFNVPFARISGGPAWVDRDRFDLVGIPPASSPASRLKPPGPNWPLNADQRQMLQMLLMDRFQLKFHRETQIVPVYVLKRGRGKLKLEDAKDKDGYPWAGSFRGGGIIGDGLAGTNATMPLLAARLSDALKRPVLDQTGLTGSYDFKYQYDAGDTEPDIASSIFASLKALGLNLKAGKGPAETIVIDHVERPSEN